MGEKRFGLLLDKKSRKHPLVLRAHSYRIKLQPLIPSRKNSHIALTVDICHYVYVSFEALMCSHPITLHASSTSNEDPLPHTCLQPKQNSAKTITTHSYTT